MKASDFTRLVPDCCSDVLEAMYFTSVLGVSHEAMPAPAEPADDPQPAADYAFGVNFQGDVSGRFGLWLGAPAARCLASNFLGEDDGSLSAEEVGEVVGELANMFCGSVASRIEGERKFVLSHPQPVTALPDAGTGDVLFSTFDTDGGLITTWIVVEGTTCNR
jgi:CheY-specific phosphatase CheX